MSTLRSIKKIHPTIQDDIGALQTRRALPTSHTGPIDPFLFLNHHGPQVYPPNNQGLPFAPHPHRGFETVTFILEGDVAHKDSSGQASIIEKGGIQWMTAGSGIVHEELSSQSFIKTGGPLEFLQLWVNLPAKHKMTTPRYIGLQSPDIKAYQKNEDVIIRPIAGNIAGQTGPIETLSQVNLATIEFTSANTLKLNVPKEHNIFFYLVRNNIKLNNSEVAQYHLVEFENDATEIEIKASKDSYILFGHGKPFGEPIVSHGPFVMNSKVEIIQAIEDYQAGKFSEIF